MRSTLIVLFILFMVSCKNGPTYSPSAQIHSLNLLDVRISAENYQTMLSNKTVNSEFPATITYGNASLEGWIRPSGARSRTFSRWSFRMRLKPEQTIEGLSLFNLSAQVHDPTMIYTTLITRLYKNSGFPVFQNRHTFLRLNKKDIGLYPMFEKIEEPFFTNRALAVAELYKSGSQIRFTFDDAFHPKLSFDKKLPDDDNYNSIVEFINAIDTSQIDRIDTSLAGYLDIEQYLTYHAITSLINNSDAFRNNFFLWKENVSGPFKIIPWDFDVSFDRKKDVGLYGKNEIIEKLLQNERTFNFYKNQLEHLLSTSYTEDFIFPVIDSTAQVIRSAYNVDNYLGNGPYRLDEEVEKLKQYIRERRRFFLQELPSFTYPLN